MIVEQRMVDALAGHAPRDQCAEIGRHRNAVAAIAAGIERVVAAVRRAASGRG